MLAAPPPVRRRRRWGLRLLIALVVLVGLLVALDRIGVAVADRMAADALQRSQNLTHRPDVSIDGFPFLTQLAAEDFDQIEVGVDDLVVGSGNTTVTLTKLHMTLHDVQVSDSFHRATARSSTATALLTYAEITRVVKVPISYAGAGRVEAKASGTVAGVTVSGRVSAKPVLSDGTLRFADPRATVDGASIPGADAVLTAVLDHAVDLSHLPWGLHVRGLAARADGVSVTLTAANLTFQR
jgi:hypothetical protein